MPRRLILFWMLAPALLIIGVTLVGGLLLTLAQSMEYMPVIGLNRFSADAYQRILTSPGFLSSLGFTLWVSLATTVLALACAVGTALVLRGQFSGKKLVMWVYQLPLMIPHLVIGVGILMLLTQSGWLARMGVQLGWMTEPADFPELVFDQWGIGIILVYLWKEIPFIGLIALAVLQSLGDDYESAARTLGANRWQTFRHVLLPLMTPALMPGSIIVFAYVFGAFEVPYLLGPIQPTMLPVEAYRRYIDVELTARPEAMATSLVIAVLALAQILAYRRVTRAYVGVDSWQ